MIFNESIRKIYKTKTKKVLDQLVHLCPTANLKET